MQQFRTNLNPLRLNNFITSSSQKNVTASKSKIPKYRIIHIHIHRMKIQHNLGPRNSRPRHRPNTYLDGFEERRDFRQQVLYLS